MLTTVVGTVEVVVTVTSSVVTKETVVTMLTMHAHGNKFV